MTVYVDDMRARYRRMTMCHMIADTDEELHAMADKIGVARKWHQGDHYDICLSKRRLAIAAGARAVTLRQLACMAANRRAGLGLDAPETAVDIFMMRHSAPASVNGPKLPPNQSREQGATE